MDLKTNGQKFEKRLNADTVSKYTPHRTLHDKQGQPHCSRDTCRYHLIQTAKVNTTRKKLMDMCFLIAILRRTHHHFCGNPAKNEQPESLHEEILAKPTWRGIPQNHHPELFKNVNIMLYKERLRNYTGLKKTKKM